MSNGIFFIYTNRTKVNQSKFKGVFLPTGLNKYISRQGVPKRRCKLTGTYPKFKNVLIGLTPERSDNVVA